jgi:hypothetical protein
MRRKGPAPLPPEERFWRHVQPTPLPGCWFWTGSKMTRNVCRYGKFGIGSNYEGTRRLIAPHIFAYLFYVGPIPGDLELDHLCRNGECVNPWHLEPVTHQENMRRAGPYSGWAQRSVCINGHPFEGNNLFMRDGTHGRGCRECVRQKCRKYRQNKKQAALVVARLSKGAK